MTNTASASGGDLRRLWLQNAGLMTAPPRAGAIDYAGSTAPRKVGMGMFADAADAPQRRVPLEMAAVFSRLVGEWQAACGHLSSTSKRVRHPAFRKIVALGRPAVSLLLEQLGRKPGDWDLALAEITGENPVPPESAGNMSAVVAAWLEWGAHRGYRR